MANLPNPGGCFTTE
jgi:hypothetical protein